MSHRGLGAFWSGLDEIVAQTTKVLCALDIAIESCVRDGDAAQASVWSDARVCLAQALDRFRALAVARVVGDGGRNEAMDALCCFRRARDETNELQLRPSVCAMPRELPRIDSLYQEMVAVVLRWPGSSMVLCHNEFKLEKELATANHFLSVYNREFGTWFEARAHQGQDTDVDCDDRASGREMRIEVTLLQDAEDDIKYILGRGPRKHANTRSFDCDLLPMLRDRLNEKLKKPYGPGTGEWAECCRGERRSGRHRRHKEGRDGGTGEIGGCTPVGPAA